MTRAFIVSAVVVALSAHAEDPKAKAAREELERELNQMVGKQPTRVKLEFEPLDEPNYKLEEATFELDGRALPMPLLANLMGDSTQVIWNGDVTPGKHTIKARVVYMSGVSPIISDEGGHRWKIGGDVSFEVHSGIEVQVKVVPKRDGSQKDIAKRFSLRLPAQPVMLAKLDDGKMPEALKKPDEVVDAGVLVAAVDPKKAAEDEKKRKAEEAAEAKRLAAEEKKRKAEEAAEAKRLAAEEKKRKAAEAAEAKRLAAEEKKRLAQEAAEAKRLAAEEKKRLAEEAKHPKPDAGQPEVVAAAVVDAGPPAQPEIVDAGAPVAVAVAEVDAGQPTKKAEPAAPVAEEGGSSFGLLIAGAGGLAIIVLLIVIARRRSRPPSVD